MQHTTLHRLVGIALLGAIAYILMLLEFPILPVAPWMKIDFSDIPILIGLFLFGVGGAFVITIIKLLLHSAMMGFAIYDLIGSFASFLGTAVLILAFALVLRYYRGNPKWRMPVAIVVATIGLVVIESLANLTFVLPFYLQVMGMNLSMSLNTVVLVAVIPFNLIKGLLVGNVFWLVYQRLAKWLGNHNQLMSRI
ncbi:ECF transporter S component [Lactiplantibacillus plantarum]|uniref:ECF transporter S component n=1 Tax=Lactiplantibacillus plantarum TaxID=1590 RepID=UPI0007B54542|nr:ECF transporter S component [Lactiplantibacillus plantarum]KZT77613.1 Substrate-specific component RibU of riboflavinECF transporter [Lactiplantibacillus plantarum]KZT87102.1 Substrate-specific component RibU of riboflavinECF transporter [Lactiplantibacillus plantarum]KZU46034.1 Substrate-specific component RibU of riboflavinECF transporter [Lactiplantibacillus plantarum]KZU49158.1 Substrate-specific component RibU of riboflavinECF transporter [Lactiplantibacillus plantarum]MCG0584748.1 ECF